MQHRRLAACLEASQPPYDYLLVGKQQCKCITTDLCWTTCLPRRRTPGTQAPGMDTWQQANLGKRKPCFQSVSQSVSQLFPKKIEGNAQSPRAARRDRSQPLATGTSVLQTLQSRRAPSPSPGQTILAHLKCTSHNHRHEVYTGPLTQEKPLSQGCSTED